MLLKHLFEAKLTSLRQTVIELQGLLLDAFNIDVDVAETINNNARQVFTLSYHDKHGLIMGNVMLQVNHPAASHRVTYSARANSGDGKSTDSFLQVSQEGFDVAYIFSELISHELFAHFKNAVKATLGVSIYDDMVIPKESLSKDVIFGLTLFPPFSVKREGKPVIVIDFDSKLAISSLELCILRSGKLRAHFDRGAKMHTHTQQVESLDDVYDLLTDEAHAK